MTSGYNVPCAKYSKFPSRFASSSKTSIKMVNNFVEIESSIRGEQGFVIYNIVGDVVMNGVFDGSISIPMHRFETATYLIRVEDSNGLSTTHKLINQ